MTISIKPTASGSTIEQDGSAILSIDASGNLTVPNNMTFSGTVTGISSYSDSDALSLFNASGSAPVYACRAWVNFNGTGTVAIRASGNVSSITDLGQGEYQVNFTTAMSDTNYCTLGSTIGTNSSGDGIFVGGFGSGTIMATTYVKVRTSYGPNNIAYDMNVMNVAVFR